MLLVLPVRSLRARGRQMQLEQAERAIDGVFSRATSLAIGRAVLAYELAKRPQRGHRRVA